MRRLLLTALATCILLVIGAFFLGPDWAPGTKLQPEDEGSHQTRFAPRDHLKGTGTTEGESSDSALDPVFRQKLQELKRWSSPFQDFVIEGHILSAGNKEPIAGATVCFYDSRNPATEEFEEVVLEVASNLQGHYRLHAKEHLRGWIVAFKAGYTAVEEQINLAQPGVVEQNFSISPAQGVILGIVRDAFTSAPLPNVRIKWFVSFELPVFPSSLSKRITFTDKMGRYEMTDLPVGEAELEASLPGFFESPQRVQIDAGLNQVDFGLIKGESFTLKVEDESGEAVAHARVERPDGRVVATDEKGIVEMPLMPEFDTIRCMIWADGYLRLEVDLDVKKEFEVVILESAPEVHGWVVSSTGEPVGGTRLDLYGTRGFTSYKQEPAYSDDSGAFSCGVSYPPLQKIEVSHPNYIEEWIDFAGHPSQPITIRLRPRETGLSGSVTDEKGDPVRRFTVILRRKDSRAPHLRKFFEHPEGRFSISSVAAGVYDLSAFMPPPSESNREVKILGATRQDIELTRGNITRLKLRMTEVARVQKP